MPDKTKVTGLTEMWILNAIINDRMDQAREWVDELPIGRRNAFRDQLRLAVALLEATDHVTTDQREKAHHD